MDNLWIWFDWLSIPLSEYLYKLIFSEEFLHKLLCTFLVFIGCYSKMQSAFGEFLKKWKDALVWTCEITFVLVVIWNKMSAHHCDQLFSLLSLRECTAEKIVDAFLSDSIPIYWGNKYASEEFNPKAFVCATDFPNEKALVNHILELSEDYSAMADMLSQPILQDPEVFEKSDKALLDFFSRIFERGPGAIQRTPMQRFLGVASRYYGHGLFRTIRYTIRRMKGEYK